MTLQFLIFVIALLVILLALFVWARESTFCECPKGHHGRISINVRTLPGGGQKTTRRCLYCGSKRTQITEKPSVADA